MWQVVRKRETLRDFLGKSLLGGPRLVASAMLTTAKLFTEAGASWMTADCPLPLTLENIGVDSTRICFLGLMPNVQDGMAKVPVQLNIESLLASELGFFSLRWRISDEKWRTNCCGCALRRRFLASTLSGRAWHRERTAALSLSQIQPYISSCSTERARPYRAQIDGEA